MQRFCKWFQRRQYRWRRKVALSVIGLVAFLAGAHVEAPQRAAHRGLH